MSFIEKLDRIKPLQLVRGPLSLFAGVAWLFKHPKYLLLGALPAVVAGVLLVAGLVTLVVFSGGIASVIDPLLTNLPEWISSTIHLTLQGAIIIGGAVLSYVLFTALALAIGDPIYSKISEVVDAEAGVKLPETSWLLGVKDALLLVLKGLLVAILAFVVSLIPAVGTLLAFGVTWTLLPFILAEDLLGRTLVPRGIVAQDKTKLLLHDKRAAWGFGTTCQFLFALPLIPVIVMPAAIAGAALLAQELVEEQAAVPNIESN